MVAGLLMECLIGYCARKARATAHATEGSPAAATGTVYPTTAAGQIQFSAGSASRWIANPSWTGWLS